MYYIMEQKVSEAYVHVKAPEEIKRGCMNSEFQFLDHKEISVELDLEYGVEFPDLIMAEQYIPLISDKMRERFDYWGIDNLFYKRINLKISELEIEEIYWLALPPRIDCLDPEEAFDREFQVCVKIAIIGNRVGNYDIFKLQGGNDEIILTQRLKELLETEIHSQNLKGIVIKDLGTD